MILLLQVLQTSLMLEKRFVGVPLSSAMFTIISFPVWFFCMSSANQNKPFSWSLPELSIRGAGQEDRSSGYENGFRPIIQNSVLPRYGSPAIKNSSRNIRHKAKHFLLWWTHVHVHEVKRMFSIVMSMKLWLILQRLRYKTACHCMEMKTSIKNVPISKFKLFLFFNARVVFEL